MKRLRRLICLIFGHTPAAFTDDKGIARTCCASCDELKPLCEWCSEREATMVVTGTEEFICRECVGV